MLNILHDYNTFCLQKRIIFAHNDQMLLEKQFSYISDSFSCEFPSTSVLEAEIIL